MQDEELEECKPRRVRIKKKFSKEQLQVVEEMQKKLAESFGVTVVHDETGKFSTAGYCYVTVRWGKKLQQVHMAILSVDE